MCKLCVFAGTTEGRELVEFLRSQPTSVTACVATEYGETLLKPGDNLMISAKRMTREDMAALFRKERFDLVVDATHPYASAVTQNICQACAETGTEYLRLLRSDDDKAADAVFVPDIPAAVAYLNQVTGNILLTTGSKELAKFSSVTDFAGRVFARTKNGTLELTVDTRGLHCRINLGGTEIGRQLYEEIKGGYTDKMSFGFVVAEDQRTETEDYENDVVTVLRTITKIKKLYDVSAVSLPANDATEISARSFCDGLIAELTEDRRKAEQNRNHTNTLKLLLEVNL